MKKLYLHIRQFPSFIKKSGENVYLNGTDFFVRNQIFLIYAVLTILFAWGFELFQLTISMDDNGDIFRGLEVRQWGGTRFCAWVEQQRWMMAILEYTLINNSVPVAPLLFSLLLSVLGFIVIFQEKERSLASYLALPIFIGCPFWYFSYSFTNLTPGIGVGFFLTACGVVFASKGWKYLPAAIILFTMALGIYQAFAIVAVTICCYLLIDSLLKKHEELIIWGGKTSRLACLMIGGLIANYYIAHFFINTYRIKQTLLLDGYININYFKSFYAFIDFIKIFFNKIFDYFKADFVVFGSDLSMQFITFIFLILFVVLFVFCSRNINWTKKILVLLLFTLLLLTPFFILAISATLSVPPRTLLAFPTMFAACVFMVTTISYGWGRILLILLVGLCSIQYFWANNRLAYMNYHAYQRDTFLTSRLISRWEADCNFPNSGKEIPIAMFGSFAHEMKELTPFNQKSTVGISLIGYNERSFDALMRILGVRGYRLASPHEYANVASEADFMPSFPCQGSVKIIDGTAVVKFSAFTPKQRSIYNIEPHVQYSTAPFVYQVKSLNDATKKVYELSGEQINATNSNFAVEDGGSSLRALTPTSWIAIDSITTDSDDGKYFLEIDFNLSQKSNITLSFTQAQKAFTLILNGGQGRNHWIFVMPADCLQNKIKIYIPILTGERIGFNGINIYKD